MRNYWQDRRRQQMQEGSKPGSYSQIGSPEAPRMADLPHAGGVQRGVQIESPMEQIPISRPVSLQLQSRPPPGAMLVPEHETPYTQTRDLEMPDWAELPWEMFPAEDQDFASWVAILECMDLWLDMNIGDDVGDHQFTNATE